MPRPSRVEFSGARYHVINRGNYRQDLFSQHQTGEAFEKTLFEACQRFGWELSAYVLMSNHYHLAIRTPEPNLCVGMQWLQSVFANRFNHFVKTPGHVFQGRYKALVIEPGPSLLRVVNYIHLNPVRAGICSLPELRSYKLGSFPKWLRKDCPPSLVCEDWLEQCGGLKRTRAGINRYEKLLALADERKPGKREEMYRQLCRGWYIGTKEGKQALLQELDDSDVMKTTALVKLHDADAALASLEHYLEENGLDAATIQGSRKAAAWKVSIARELREKHAVSNRWLSEHLNMGHPCAVSRLLNQ